MKRNLMLAAVAALSLSAGWANAAEKGTIYGSQLMTRQERMEYRNKMRATKSVEERERIRAEHHEQMQQRAQERGMKLPDAPPAVGGGMGPGMGGGMGPGMGGGMGPGMGPGRRGN